MANNHFYGRDPFKKIRFFAYKHLTFTDQCCTIVSEGG